MYRNSNTIGHRKHPRVLQPRPCLEQLASNSVLLPTKSLSNHIFESYLALRIRLRIPNGPINHIPSLNRIQKFLHSHNLLPTLVMHRNPTVLD